MTLREECGRDFGIHTTKQGLATAAFYLFTFMASITVPIMISAAISTKTTKSFCDTNVDICNLYQDWKTKNSLIEDVKSTGYTLGGVGSVLGTCMAAAIIFAVATLRSLCKPKENTSEEAPLRIQDNESNHCSGLFKRFKDNVLPTKWEVLQLLVTVATLIGGAAFAAWFTAIGVESKVCNSDTFLKGPPCKGYFPEANAEQLKKVLDLSDHLYQTIMIFGIVLSAIISLIMTVGTMTIAACIKHQMSETAENRIGNEEITYGGTDYEL